MKKVVKMKSTEKTPNDVLSRIVPLVQDERNEEYQPGQYVVMDAKGERVKKVVTITGPTKTEQSYKDMLDINKLLEPAHRKGLLRHGVKFEGEYDDIPVGDFQEAMFVVAKGKNMFEQLPSKTRLKFDNDPGKFMEFVQDPENKQWLIDNGIAKGLDGIDGDGNPTGYDPNPASEPEPTPASEPEPTPSA